MLCKDDIRLSLEKEISSLLQEGKSPENINDMFQSDVVSLEDAIVSVPDSIVDRYWDAQPGQEPGQSVQTPDEIEKEDTFEDDRDILQEQLPQIFQAQDVGNIETLNEAADDINDSYPNMVAEIVEDPDNPGKVMINLNNVEAIPESLQDNLVGKSFNAFEVAKITMNKTLSRLGKVFPELRFEFVNPFTLKQEEHLLPIEQINSFVRGNTVSLVEGRFDKDASVEEFLHPFISGLKAKNPQLFQELLQDNKDKYQKEHAYYKKLGEDVADIEVVTKALTDKVVNPSLLQRVMEFLRDVFRKLFPASKSLITSDTIPTSMKIDELGAMLRNGGYRFEHYYTQQPFYNAVNPNATKQERAFKDLLNASSKYNIQKISKDGGYTENGRPIARVSDDVNAKNEKAFGNKSRTEIEQIEAANAAEEGTDLHGVIEDVLARKVDKATGLLKDTPSDIKNLNGQTEAVYNKIEGYVDDLIGSFPEGTRFLWENVLFNPDRGSTVDVNGKKEYRKGLAGTVDFIAVTPDAKYHVLDWKFIDNTNANDAIKSYKRDRWETQMSHYIDMVKLATGAPSDSISTARMVPFIRKSTYNKATKSFLLSDVITPNIDVKKIVFRKMLPYISERENIKDNNIRDFLSKVKSLLDLQLKKDALEGFKHKYDYQLQNRIEESVADFMVLGNLNSLYTLHDTYAKEAASSLEELLALKDADISNTGKLHEKLNTIFEMIEALTGFKGAAQELYGDTLEKSLVTTPEEKLAEDAFKEKIRVLSDNIDVLRERHKKANLHIASVQARTEFNIHDLSATEKKVSGFNRVFTFLSSPETRTAYAYGAALNRAYSKLNLIIKGQLNRIDNLLHNLHKEQKRDVKEVYHSLLDFKDNKFTGLFKKRISQKFWDDRDALVETKSIPKLKAFFSAYYDFQKIQDDFKYQLDKRTKDINNADYQGNARQVAARKKKALKGVNDRWNLSSSPEAYKNITGYKIAEEGAFSDAYHEQWYKDLLKPSNKSIKDIYDYAMEVNEDLWRNGADINRYTFVPNFEKGFIEKGGKQFFSTLKGKVQVNSNQGLYGAVNHATGELIQHINIPGVNDFFDGNYERKSTDILRSYGEITRHLEKAKVLMNLEPFANTLLRVEGGKKVYGTNYKGDIVKKNKEQKADPIVDDANRKYLKQFIDNVHYGRKIQEGWDKQWTTHNDKTGETRTYSATAIMQLGLNGMYLKTFGLNVLTPLRTALSGLINNNVLGTRHFNTSFIKDSTEAFYNTITSSKRKNDKKVAAIGYFLPFINQQFNKKIDELSMNKLTEWTSFEFLTRFMEDADHVIQMNIASNLLDNTIVLDGKLANAREYVRSLPEFASRYEDKTRISQYNKLIEQRIKDVIKEKGLINNSKVTDGKLQIEGLTDEDASISYFSNLVQFYAQRVTGMNPEWNAIGYKNSLAGKLFSQYRTWIPNTVSARYGKVKLNSQLQDYQWGRHLSFWDSVGRSFKSNYKSKVLPTLLGLGAKKDLVTYAMKKYADLRQKMEYEGRTFTEDFIDENEFIDTYLSNLEATVKEFRVMMGLMLLLSTAFFAGGAGSGDDDATKSLKKFAQYHLDRMQDEFSFYYNPSSVGSILKSPVPAISYVSQLIRALTALPRESYKPDKTHATKDLLAPIPVVSEFMKYIPMFDSEWAKSLGIKQASTNNFIN